MLKYKYLYKEYLLRMLLLTIVLLITMFLQFGFMARTESLRVSFISTIPDIFLSIQFVISMLLFDNFKKSKMEVVRTKHLFLSFFERLILTVIMMILVRLIACSFYSIIVYHNFDNFEFIFRVIFCDLCNILICYTFFNIIKNRYVGLIISLIIGICLYIPKWLQYDIISINGDNFSSVGFMPFIGLFVYLIGFIISIIWRKEYVRD